MESPDNCYHFGCNYAIRKPKIMQMSQTEIEADVAYLIDQAASKGKSMLSKTSWISNSLLVSISHKIRIFTRMPVEPKILTKIIKKLIKIAYYFK